ncbi:MAG: hypothetical protein QG608_1333 [Actinomycetota bacterium]|nr:hypothetical protein [Actinomycetota bacterium]
MGVGPETRGRRASAPGPGSEPVRVPGPGRYGPWPRSRVQSRHRLQSRSPPSAEPSAEAGRSCGRWSGSYSQCGGRSRRYRSSSPAGEAAQSSGSKKPFRPREDLRRQPGPSPREEPLSALSVPGPAEPLPGLATSFPGLAVLLRAPGSFRWFAAVAPGVASGRPFPAGRASVDAPFRAGRLPRSSPVRSPGSRFSSVPEAVTVEPAGDRRTERSVPCGRPG